MAAKRRGDSDQPPQSVSGRAGSGWSVDSDQSEAAYVFYNELVRSRDRLAEFPPLTPQDLERIAWVMDEVIFYLITPPPGARSDLSLADAAKDQLVRAAKDRGLDLYVSTVALLAHKLSSAQPPAAAVRSHLDLIEDSLDALTFDYRTAKQNTLATLRSLKTDLESRVAYVRGQRAGGYRFLEMPETYRSRKRKAKRPDEFFRRVYAGHVLRGLTQADIRRADPAFYNMLHVWCTRHDRKLATLVPASRPRRG
jgi:hypothetical protein